MQTTATLLSCLLFGFDWYLGMTPMPTAEEIAQAEAKQKAALAKAKQQEKDTKAKKAKASAKAPSC